MNYKASDVAKFIVNHVNDTGKSVSNMTLQKILYCLQGYSYAVFGEQLFDDELEAWACGPVVRSVYSDLSYIWAERYTFL